MGASKPFRPPNSILIIGSGVFGLSTALHLTSQRDFAKSTITILDRSPEDGVFPARDASSIDSSRIIRADYADPAYARLAAEAAHHWRQQAPHELGGEGRYTESGLFLVANRDGTPGLGYTQKSWINAMAIANADGGRGPMSVRVGNYGNQIQMMTAAGGVIGNWGYLNDASGWADATASMHWLYEKVVATGRVKFVNGTAERLDVKSPIFALPGVLDNKPRVVGAILEDGTKLSADLTIVATGAWTPSLLDLQGQAVATGQMVAYLDITEEEQARLNDIPVLLNLSTGFFIIPPRDRVLKVARHSYGYLNPTEVPTPLGMSSKSAPLEQITETSPTTNGTTEVSSSTSSNNKVKVSKPRTHLSHPPATPTTSHLPPDGEAQLRAALKLFLPWMADADTRPFRETRLCWYTDTASGDWIIDYHPSYSGLFVATGGSGHAFKFLPILGEKVVGCLRGSYPAEFANKWRWRGKQGLGDGDAEKTIMTEDGSRGGVPGLVLEDELARTTAAVGAAGATEEENKKRLGGSSPAVSDAGQAWLVKPSWSSLAGLVSRFIFPNEGTSHGQGTQHVSTATPQRRNIV
ncbi:FAD dependent oxidoreductase-domain-containing protein [Microdochium bolleyi]|uniref:FAD dependent oxidoreductase-domain-containing protein n=1 Tax=Microdochium bolleyi TaxID=196109 RepID=A0A136IXP8_9PEZI|nr:FAD dependent oxidoreductase-domain-containing protein [Microdochium bolleyi]